MRRLILALLLLLPLLAVPCSGAEVPSFPQVDELLEKAEGYGVEGTDGLEAGARSILSAAGAQLDGLIRRSLRLGLKLMAVVLLCGLAEGACLEGRSGGLQAVEMAGAATGGVSGAAVRQGATVLCSSLLIRGIDGLLVPMLYAYIAACCAHAALGSDGLKKLAALLKGTIVFLLTAGLLAFVGYLTASGAIAGSADAAAVKAAKMTISRAIPVVGGILSDAAETVLAGAGVLRGTVGVVGMLVVLAICLTPFLQLTLHYLTYKGAAALTGTVAGPRLSGLMDSLGGAFGLILGMTGSCALVLLFSIVSAVSAVMG